MSVPTDNNSENKNSENNAVEKNDSGKADSEKDSFEEASNNLDQASQAILSQAAAECRLAGAERLSSEHLLLALIADQDGKAGKALAACNVKIDVARKEAKKMMPNNVKAAALCTHDHEGEKKRGSAAAGQNNHDYEHEHEHGHGDGHEHSHEHQIAISAMTKWVLADALEQARECGAQKIAPEHILLAILSEGVGMAARLLAFFKVDQKKLSNLLK